MYNNMDGIISYTDQIKKFISGKEYAGKNIQTSDGITSYITQTGIAKPYKYSLSDTNGCTSAIERIDSKLQDLGVPIGSLMAKGQSCGNETKYVQSLPPDVNFDWKFYIQSNPDLNLTTEEQARSHWTSTGIHNGLLPNQNILSNMSNVGKLGYIDVNTIRHPVHPNTYTHTGEYKLFDTTNITGTSMQNCIVPPPSIAFGDQMFIKNNDRFGSINQQSLLEFNNEKTILFLRPPPGSNAVDGTPIKYGDEIVISATSANSYTKECGWWGCKVAYVNSDTTLLTFGSGGEKPKTFIVSVPLGTNFKSGTEIKYGNQFSLEAIVEIEWSQQAGIDYSDHDMNQTIPQQPKWDFWSGWVSQPSKIQNSSIKPLAECQQLCASTSGCVGIVTDNSGKNNCWLKDKFAVANVNNDRNSYMLKSAAKQVAEIPSMSWNEQAKTDYGGNDINHTIKPLEQCKSSCASTIGCEGIVTDNSGKNNCWLKKKFGNGTNNNNRQTYMLSVPVKLPPFTKSRTNERIVGSMYSTNVSFGNGSGQNIFTFESVSNPPYVPACNIKELKTICAMNKSCNGFIHSKKDNTWQQISNITSPDMYKITDLPPNIYVKDIVIENSRPEFIDSNMFASYPTNSKYFVNNGDCNVVDCSKIQSKQQLYNRTNKVASQQGDEMIKNYTQIQPYIKKIESIYNQLNSNTNEYKTVLKTIKKKNEQYNDTYNQQNNDLALLQDSNKLHVFAWGLSSIIVIAMVVMLKNRQT